MINFEKFIDRHGECGVQALIDRMEHYEGIRPDYVLSLEERWNFLMHPAHVDQRMAA